MELATVNVYIRFGEIPEDGKSSVYRGDTVVGKEPGLSVWECVESYGAYYPVLPKDANRAAIGDYFKFLLDSKSKVYLVTGSRIIYEGHDREPLLQDVVVLKDLTRQFRSTEDIEEMLNL